MDNLEKIKNLISTVTGEENYYFAVNRILVKFMDSLEGGVFLNQLIYWSDRSVRSDGFFYKSAKDWYEEIYLSEYHINKHIKKLREAGIVETKKIKANGAPTIHYKLDINTLLISLDSFFKNLEMETEKFENGNQNISESIPENLEMETPKIENENPKIQESIRENSENDFEKFGNGNQNISESLTKTTTKTISKNTSKTTQGINKKEYNNNQQQENTTTSSALNKSYSVDSKNAEKIEEDDGGGLVPFNDQLEQVRKSFIYAFDDLNEKTSKELPFIVRQYDYRLICEVCKDAAMEGFDALESPISYIINTLTDWRNNRGIATFEQLINEGVSQ